jgi:putative peptide-modifying radical SAM enzyme
MLYIVLTTPICNLNCRYCGGSLHGMPDTITYKKEQLYDLICKDNDSVVAFYGGEPLLQPNVVQEFLSYLPAKHFVINTNGYFIKKIKDEIPQFDTILLSIDGRKDVTDFYREEGCYDKVMDAVKIIHTTDFKGELIARMAVSYKTDIYLDVKHLIDRFPFVHWQVDAVWSALWELPEFKTWVESSYKPGLRKLVSWWVSEIQQGNIPGIIPFLGIMSRLLHGGGGLPCQAGDGAIAITTDGKILACPIAPDFEWNNLGDLSSGYHKIHVDEPCLSCDVYDICGGRCLFANKERLWGQEGFDVICDMTKFLIYELKQYIPVCETFKEKLFYPPYNNTTEIIP